jgi:hypothetical protein
VELANKEHMASTGISSQLASILSLHRHLDGVVSFARESDEIWLPAFAVRAADLENMFPEIVCELVRDSFMSINAAHRMARGSRGLRGRPDHKQKTLRYLCACYCDIDFYRKGLTCDEALAYVRELTEAGKLPAFSALVRSGQGVWLLWLLHDEKNNSQAHVGAYDDRPTIHLQLHRKINQEIGRRLAPIGADPAAVDAARYIRVPEFFRNDVEEWVRWDWQQHPASTPVSYTLRQLANQLGVYAAISIDSTQPQRTQQAGAKCPARRNGFDVANRNKLRVFRLMWKLRNGCISKGIRSNAAFILAACLKWNGYSLSETVGEVSEFGQTCSPPLPKGECLSAVKSAYKPCVRKMSYQTIADRLEINPHEAQIISVDLHTKFPSAACFGSEEVSPGWRENGKRVTQRLLRRLEIHKLIQESAAVPSLRALQRMLRQVGIVVGHVTIMADLKALRMSGEGPSLEPLFSSLP